MTSSLLTPLLALSEGGGFNPMDLAGGGGIFWTWLIFLLSLPFIWTVVMKKVTVALLERDDKAVLAISSAEEASRAAEAARAEVEVKLGEAQAEAAKLLGEARERAEVREREIIEEAKASAEALLENARKSIQAEQDKALNAIRAEVVDLSLNAAGAVLGRNVSADDDRRLVRELIGSGEGQA
ncbi:MAG: F0F1 ATP synthase subunit B [Planctomycetota bacterium]|jgi:F-type H+-transporting ATPase subunit b|nr:ATP synthase F0 subunit B [Planctomycetota bacterium]MDP6520340.1 F0F1 ATP synthase subunit B [Planctomycetota bacterium]MDP6839750.1 F0F1 ATP synthase subunit B [Planctomycetota bacterium]MDP6956799.1 F0F1 ATP synthase subunit B [Planctomycetota bacterium]